MVPGVVGSNPISHPTQMTLAFAGVLCLLDFESVKHSECRLINNLYNNTKLRQITVLLPKLLPKLFIYLLILKAEKYHNFHLYNATFTLSILFRI